MSISNFITNILQLQDLNINFSDKIITMKKKNILYNVISGLLTYTPDFCPVCGSINEKNSIIKYGTKSSDIKLLPFNGCPLILRLKKQRFLCTHCNHTFSAKTNIVEKNCYISNQVKMHILNDLKFKISEKDIAYMNFVSHSTVSRSIDNCFNKFKPNINILPPNLMFDEFKSTKDANGSMSFVFADADTHKIIDIVENRQLPFLQKYFSKYTKQARDGVKTVCIDMYSPYISLIKDTFKNADIIIDRFHVIQLLNRAFQKTRIDVMKHFSTSSIEYKRLKRYWKLISKDRTCLNGINFYHRTHFREWVSDRTIEGLNNYIKVIKRVAFGYKSFHHFRSRILIARSLIHPIKISGGK